MVHKAARNVYDNEGFVHQVLQALAQIIYSFESQKLDKITIWNDESCLSLKCHNFTGPDEKHLVSA